jgi:hypothetical protein
VDHLDVVAGAAGPHVVHARLAVVGFRRNRPEDRRQSLPGLALTSGHDGRPPQRPLLAAGDARADVVEALGGEFLAPPLGVEEQGVAPVNQDVSRLQMRLEMRDGAVDRGAGRHHHQHAARPLQHRHQRLWRRREIDAPAGGGPGDECAALGRFEIVARDAEPVAFHVEGQIGAHDAEPDDTDVTLHVRLP